MTKIKVNRLDETGHTSKCLELPQAVAYINGEVKQSECWVLLDGGFHSNKQVTTADLAGIAEVTLQPQVVGG